MMMMRCTARRQVHGDGTFDRATDQWTRHMSEHGWYAKVLPVQEMEHERFTQDRAYNFEIYILLRALGQLQNDIRLTLGSIPRLRERQSSMIIIRPPRRPIYSVSINILIYLLLLFYSFSLFLLIFLLCLLYNYNLSIHQFHHLNL